MTDRLAEIKDRYHEDHWVLTNGDVDWLIREVERLRALCVEQRIQGTADGLELSEID